MTPKPITKAEIRRAAILQRAIIDHAWILDGKRKP